MKLNESQEAKIKNYIKKIVKESIESMGDYSQFEGDYKKDYPHKGENEKPLHNPNGTSDQNNENDKEEMLRSSVEKFFKSNNTVGRKVDIAGYAYQLDGIKPSKGEDSNEMKNSRSLFMKKLNHEPNDQGYPYSFSTAEINRLASMISSNNKLNEAVESAIKKVVNEIGYHEKQKNDQSEEEYRAWLDKKSASKKKNQKPSEDNGGAIDYHDYKNGKGNFRPMSNSKIEEIVARAVRRTLKEWKNKK